MTDWNEATISYKGQEVCTEEAFMVWCDLGNDPTEFNETVAVAVYDKYFDY